MACIKYMMSYGLWGKEIMVLRLFTRYDYYESRRKSSISAWTLRIKHYSTITQFYQGTSHLLLTFHFRVKSRMCIYETIYNIRKSDPIRSVSTPSCPWGGSRTADCRKFIECKMLHLGCLQHESFECLHNQLHWCVPLFPHEGLGWI